jgi:hypothetical protein
MRTGIIFSVNSRRVIAITFCALPLPRLLTAAQGEVSAVVEKLSAAEQEVAGLKQKAAQAEGLVKARDKEVERLTRQVGDWRVGSILENLRLRDGQPQCVFYTTEALCPVTPRLGAWVGSQVTAVLQYCLSAAFRHDMNHFNKCSL